MKIRIAGNLLLLSFALTLAAPFARAADAEEKVRESVQKYGKAWGERDVEKRTKLLTSAWAESGTYTDPTAHIEGRAALVQHIDGFLNSPEYKGFRIDLTSDTDIHHRSFRFEWAMKNPAGEVVTAGMDYGEFNEDGQITKIVGFFGPFPELKR